MHIGANLNAIKILTFTKMQVGRQATKNFIGIEEMILIVSCLLYPIQQYYNLRISRHDDVTIHVKNLQKLLLEVYKTLYHLYPSYLWENFQTKSIPYNLRIKFLCELPQRSHTIKYGINSEI